MKKNKKDSKNKGKLKGCLGSVIRLFWTGYFIIMAIGVLIGGIGNFFKDDTENIRLADGFTIEAYDVALDVQEDNKVFVTETLDVDWTSSLHHGLFKFTPEWLEYTGKDGDTIKRKSKVSDLKCTTDPYSVDKVKKKPRIKIGDPDKYVPEGNKQYVIKYTYDMGKDPFKNFDEFIFHAYGDFWGTEIKNATIQVKMPKSIEGYNVNFFMDKNRSQNATEYVDYEVKGNTLYAKFNQEKYTDAQREEYCSQEYNWHDGVCEFPEDSSYYNQKLEKSLTVDIELPNDYFVGGSWNYGWGSFIIILLIIGVTIYTIITWRKYGKDYKKQPKTIEFYPPEDLNAAQVGYIYGNKSGKKLTIALIVQLAAKGYIRIDDLKDKEKNIRVTNLYARPKPPISVEKRLDKRVIEVKKLKDIDANLDQDARSMMGYLFKTKDTKKLKTNIKKFLKVSDALVDGGYIEILSDNEAQRRKDIEILEAEYKKLEDEYIERLEEYSNTMGEKKPLSPMEKIVYDRLFQNDDTIIISEHKTLYKAFDEVDKLLKTEMKDLIHDKKATHKMFISVILTVVMLIMHLVGYYVIEDMNPQWWPLYAVSFACIFVNLFFTIFMKRKTKYGEEILSRIEGFRNFLNKVEKKKLEELVTENPEYFYDILPYTYALGLSKVWINKFENIPMEEMNMGTFDYASDRAYYAIYNNVEYPAHVSTGRSSSSSSSCGGGCSSCGGGCSSCGGGGSW